ncbi:hypothetical protein [Planomonospora sp. ID82291]|uniref:hypothetical protein n=1 Tax=Planomonospora sp. ID82291 TaxID=2738136 RepID=UPI0018C366A2|nr:hypothetical protein [Planomonospora sp. ID82291]MBG0813774.1 hypothetical protein [Planomonospora sp. ID82291]
MTGTPAPENAGLPDRSAPGREEPSADAPRRSHGRPYGESPEGEPYRGAPWPAPGAWPAPPETHPGHPSGTPAPPDPAFGHPVAAPPPPAPPVAAPAAQPVAAPAAQPAAAEPQPAGLPWMPAPRQVFPDEQVWPPVPRPARESPGSSTQPFPAVPTPPLPRRAAPTAGGPAPTPGGPAPVTAAAPAAASAAGLAAPPPVSRPDASETCEETPPAAGTAVPAPRRRTALRFGGLLVAVALAVGIPTWEGYGFYRSGIPALRFHIVEPGDSGTLMHVAWRAEVEPADSLPGLGKAKPGRKWLKITVSRTSLNTEGVIRRGEPTIKAVHPDGRSWQVLIADNDLPLEVKEHKVGTAYRYNAVSVVPQEVADEVEVHVVPSTIRVPLEEESVEQLFKRAGTEKTEPRDRVLLFRR